MSPSWYDLLGVESDASTEEIRAAWKGAIADLDPADRRFRLLTHVAEVLLDPSARASYDATAPEVEEVAPERSRSVFEHTSPGLETGASAPSSTTGRDTSPGLETGASAPSSTTGRDAPPGRETGDTASSSTTRRGVAGWVLAGFAVLTALMVGLGAWLAAQPSDAAVADATTGAQSAAEEAAATILSYDYRSMDQDQAAAGALMTNDYRQEYDRLFSALEGDAAEVKIQVSTELVASGIERAGADRVTVLVFVNRPTLNATLTEPVVYRDQVTMTMEKDGDQWLVDGMETTPVGA